MVLALRLLPVTLTDDRRFHAGVGKIRVTESADGTARCYWRQNPTFGVHPRLASVVHALLANAG